MTDRPYADLSDKQLRALRRAMAADDPQRPALEAEFALRREVSGYFWHAVAAGASALVSLIVATVSLIQYFRN